MSSVPVGRSNGATAYAYRAVLSGGGVERGIIQASSRSDAAQIIRGRGAFPIEVAKTRVRRSGRRVSSSDLALGLRALSTLLSSGLSISRTLTLLDDLVPPSWTPALLPIREHVARGHGLADAIDAAGLPLPPHVLGVIRAGEAGSELHESVERAATLLEDRAARRSELRSALSYPTMLAVAGGATVALLVGVVLPRFVELLAESGQVLPLSTRVVLAVGNWARPTAVVTVVLTAMIAAAWTIWTRRPNGLRQWHKLLFRTPLLGPIRKSSATANLCASLSAMLESGVPLAGALPHAARATGDAHVASALMAARKRIVEGQAFSAALEEQACLTPTSVRLVRVGEETGELASMLTHGARIEAESTMARLRRLIRMVEPAMILVFGGVVVLVAAALLQAMYAVRPGL